MKAKDVMGGFQLVCGRLEIIFFMEGGPISTLMPVIRRRGIAVVKMHNDYRIAYDSLLYIILELVNFVFSPRSWY